MRHNLRSRVLPYAVIAALAACQPSAPRSPLLPTTAALANAQRSEQTCAQRINDTLARVEECIQQASLWNYLAQFQRIADRYPDDHGHGNRDTGTPGYAASVAYVADLMRRAGYSVRIQQYHWKKYLHGDAVPKTGEPVEIPADRRSDLDYNVIADSPYGDPNHVVTVEGHLDSIYGAGMLDNASGSSTMLDVALAMAKTPTRNHLRYIWFGGEELGLFGSRYYTKHLTNADLRRIVFDVDVDVTATPNYDILIADPANARRAKEFPPNVIPESKVGNDYFTDFFRSAGVVSRRGNNNGTDSISFSLAGIPNTGILTEQDCCKHRWETRLWGGFLGNYEGKIPSFNGGCVDRRRRWCDNLDNNNAAVLELMTKAVASVTFNLANRKFRR
ncbi:MAG: M28 family peptidase [Candidatus Eremiobacteraeota bacterium]|nr:M28 family peptidase [Candidatus Eremiobacteraeota bacterium]